MSAPYPVRILSVTQPKPGGAPYANDWGVVRVEHLDGTSHPDLSGDGLAELAPGTIIEIPALTPVTYRGRPQIKIRRPPTVLETAPVPEPFTTRARLDSVIDHGPDFSIGRITFADEAVDHQGAALPPFTSRRFRCGYALGIDRTDDARITCRWAHDEHYGWQVEVLSVAPDTTTIVRLLTAAASGHRIGWGAATCRKLVDRYGPDTLHVLLGGQSDRIVGDMGIAPEKVRALIEAVAGRSHLDVELRLIEAGIGPITRTKILRLFSPETKEERAKRGPWAPPRPVLTRETLTADPYALRGQVSRLRFDDIDRLAVVLNIPADSPARLRAWTEHLLRTECENEGHTIVSGNTIAGKVVDRLRPECTPAPDDFLSDRVIDVGGGMLSLGDVRSAETFIVDRLRPGRRTTEAAETVRARLHDIDPALSAEQLDAGTLIVTNRASLLVGAAGTGKTRLLSAAIAYLNGEDVIVGATTSAAAANIRNRLDGETKVGTLHSLLRLRPGAEWPPDRSSHPLPCKFFIGEEWSMAHSELCAGSLARLPEDAAVCLSGDDHQLPAVGCGDVLRDLVGGGRIPVARLTVQHRTDASRLLRVLQWIRGGARTNPSTYPALTDWEDGIAFVDTTTAEDTRDRAIALVTRELPALTGVATEDILLLTPMRKKGPATSVHSLTPALRLALNPFGEATGVRGLHVGDPVVQLVNAPMRGIHNGASGRLVKATAEGIYVDFGDDLGEVLYLPDEAEELAPAYANTAHKAQGGEAAFVVVLVDSEASRLLDNRWLYTAISRARRLCVVVGPTSTFLAAARRTRPRNTGLRTLAACPEACTDHPEGPSGYSISMDVGTVI